jgi:hypothetical protein
MQIASVGIDLGKTTFHFVTLDDHGKILARSKFSRKQLLAYTANLPSSLIGIEACSGAHFIGAGLARTVARSAADPGAVSGGSQVGRCRLHPELADGISGTVDSFHGRSAGTHHHIPQMGRYHAWHDW